MANLDYDMLPQGVDGVEDLVALALDLRNCWDHGTDEVWRRLDPELWALTRNPWLALQTVSRTRLKALCADRDFRQQVAKLVSDRQRRLNDVTWFQRAHPDAPLKCLAYFSMEFGLSEALPIYSGGLGNVAGDQLKTAADLGVPVVGVGLLYQQGYFRQFIDVNGSQTELYPYNDPGQLPISAVRDQDGEWLRLQFDLPGHRVWIRVWHGQIGRVKLYLLDSNDPANPPTYRGVTSELYGGGPVVRLHQELVLGIAGWNLLSRLGLDPEVCHLNEGHAAFAVLERARSFMEQNHQPFEVALAATRAGNLFTTHTPVAAGFDRFGPALLEQYLKPYAERRLGISFKDLMALGRENPDNPGEPFNMAYLAIHGSGAVNAVSRLHGEVSRDIFQPLFPRWPRAEVPIGHVTNGVHMPTWDSLASDRLWMDHCGPGRWRGEMQNMAAQMRAVPDAVLWKMRSANRDELVRYVRDYSARASAAPGRWNNSPAGRAFDADTMTMGFARRFATYKRPNLLLHDAERLVRILTNPRYPVQLVVAGKAHPADQAGKAMVQSWVRFAERPEVLNHVVFLSDYDLLLAEHLVRGVDLWINTPRRPWEACGTSGMKVLVNGGLNLSELDGWWAEAYSADVGWALGDGQYHDEDPQWDAAEAEQLYALLEREVIPSFYDRNEQGIPSRWLAKMRESMARLTPQFSANRAVREYTERYYVPAAAAYRKLAADKGAPAEEMVHWRDQIRQHWHSVHFGNARATTADGRHEFHVQVYLDDLQPEMVAAELYAESKDGGPPVRYPMMRGAQLVGAAMGWDYSARVPSDRPASDFTARLIPAHRDAPVPLFAPEIKWQR